MRKPAAAASVAFHGAATIAIAILPLLSAASPPARARKSASSRYPLRPLMIAKSGGGGQRQPLPASRGAAPQPVPRQFTIPPTMASNLAPKLRFRPRLLEAPRRQHRLPRYRRPPRPHRNPFRRPGRTFRHRQPRLRTASAKAPAARARAPARNESIKLHPRASVIYKRGARILRRSPQSALSRAPCSRLRRRHERPRLNIRVVRSLGLGLDEKAIAASPAGNSVPPSPAGRP